jgi:hypothetical protein
MSEADVLLQEEREGESPPRGRRWYIVALGITFLLVLVVVAFLPLAVRSMVQVLGRESDPLYDLLTGELVAPTVAHEASADGTYINIAVFDLDEASGKITLAVSGNRTCAQTCLPLDITFVALDDNADQRQGLPPSATIKLAPSDTLFSQEVQLPMRGQPSLYPFDKYQLWLGVGGTVTRPDGAREEITAATLTERRAVVTLQNQVLDMIMLPPAPVDPASVTVPTDPFGFLAVQALTFERPAYLEVLAVVLVLLVAISALLALFTRQLDELALGFGGLILGVWGVRSILMPQSIGSITAIDLALSWLILLLLLGLSVRAILHFHNRSELRLHHRLLRRGKTERSS